MASKRRKYAPWRRYGSGTLPELRWHIIPGQRAHPLLHWTFPNENDLLLKRLMDWGSL